MQRRGQCRFVNGFCVQPETPDRSPTVLHVTTAHRADDVRIFDRECRSLADHGYRVCLAASGTLPSDSGISLLGLREPPKNRPRRFASGLTKGLALSRAVTADLWHFHDPELLPVAVLLARSGERVVWDAHEDYLTQLRSGAKSWMPGPIQGVAVWGLRKLLASIDKHAVGVVAATPTIAAKYTNRNTVLVGNEARLEPFVRCTPSYDSMALLFIGAPGPGHLFHEVVEAVAPLKEVRLRLAGREPSPEGWRAARALLGDRLSYLGWLDRAGLAAAMNETALGLVTYSDTEPYADGFPTKAFEFAAAGLPMVATPNRTIREVFETHGLGVVASSFTSPALRIAIESALNDRSQWEQQSDRIRDWAVEADGWTDSERRLLGLYDEVLPRSAVINFK